MAQSAIAAIPRTTGMEMLSIDSLFAQLPARLRTDLRWTEESLRGGVRTLQTAALTDDAVARAGDEIRKPLLAILDAVRALTTVEGANANDALEGAIERDSERLREFVSDEAAQDSLRWITGLNRAFVAYMRGLSRADVAKISTVSATSAAEAILPDPFVRFTAVMMAAYEIERAGGDVRRARDLVDVAFIEAISIRDILRGAGIKLDPFPNETNEERHARFLRAAAHVRASMTDDDWRVMDEAMGLTSH